MLIAQFLQTDFPTLRLTDSVFYALQLMDDFEIRHLPVVTSEELIGVIGKDSLLDAPEDALIETLQHQFIVSIVKKEEHFLAALKACSEHKMDLVAVLNEQKEYAGVVLASTLLEQLSTYLAVSEPGGMIVLELERRNYSFGEISRLVETNDAYITQLNTYTEAETGLVIVTIKVNKVEISDIIATFHRYEYVVRYFFGEEDYTNELRENYNHLMAYLNI